MNLLTVITASGETVSFNGNLRVINVKNMCMINQIPDNYCGHGLYVIARIDSRDKTAAYFPAGSWQRWWIARESE